jgi:hypothetical protein
MAGVATAIGSLRPRGGGSGGSSPTAPTPAPANANIGGSYNLTTTGGGVALATTGTAHVAADGSITGALSGTYHTPSGTSGNAVNHHLQMVRR